MSLARNTGVANGKCHPRPTRHVITHLKAAPRRWDAAEWRDTDVHLNHRRSGHAPRVGDIHGHVPAKTGGTQRHSRESRARCFVWSSWQAKASPPHASRTPASPARYTATTVRHVTYTSSLGPGLVGSMLKSEYLETQAPCVRRKGSLPNPPNSRTVALQCAVQERCVAESVAKHVLGLCRRG